MSLDFPAPAGEGQTYSNEGSTYIFHNDRWMQVGSSAGGGGGGGDGGIDNVVEDPTPQLGGDLDLNGHVILGLVPGINVQPYSSTLANTTASFTLADETKLDALPTAAGLAATYAPLTSPSFSGTPTVPNVTYPDDSTKVANTAYVTDAVAAAGGGLDTEAVQDVVGAMIGTVSGITVAYDDGLGKINYTVTASGTGDVTGPAIVTADNPAIFSGTTGKVIKQATYAAFKGSLSLVKGDVGLGNVDNTADTAKPVSTAQQTALNLKANLIGPSAFSGDITVPNQTALDNTTKAANTAFVTGAVSALSGTVTTSLSGKANLVGGATFSGGSIQVPNVTAGTNDQQAANTAFVQTAVGTAVGGQINAATAKTTLVDADLMALTDSAASFALKKITWANVKAALISWLGTSAAGAGEQLGIITSLGLTAGQTLGPVAPGGGAFTVGSASPMSYATLAEYLTGTNPNLVVGVDILRFLQLVKTITYATTVALKHDGLLTGDSLVNLINCTGNCAVTFHNSIHAGLAWQSGRLILNNSGGGARTVSLATGGGVTVSGVASFPLGSTANNKLIIDYTIMSTTTVYIDNVRAI